MQQFDNLVLAIIIIVFAGLIIGIVQNPRGTVVPPRLRKRGAVYDAVLYLQQEKGGDASVSTYELSKHTDLSEKEVETICEKHSDIGRLSDGSWVVKSSN